MHLVIVAKKGKSYERNWIFSDCSRKECCKSQVRLKIDKR